MSITTAQSLSGALDGSGSIAGSIVTLRELGPQSKVAPAGFTIQISSVNPASPIIGNAGGINFVSPGFDPVVVSALQVVLRSTGQIWPVGFS
jgi:hypothetical protein